jgi:hypothetical protein
VAIAYPTLKIFDGAAIDPGETDFPLLLLRGSGGNRGGGDYETAE